MSLAFIVWQLGQFAGMFCKHPSGPPPPAPLAELLAELLAALLLTALLLLAELLLVEALLLAELLTAALAVAPPAPTVTLLLLSPLPLPLDTVSPEALVEGAPPLEGRTGSTPSAQCAAPNIITASDRQASARGG